MSPGEIFSGTNTYEKIVMAISPSAESKFKTISKPRSLQKKGLSFIKKSNSHMRIDNKNYRDITATLESVRKQVETKISSSSLFSSIQDVVNKNAPKKVNTTMITNPYRRNRIADSLKQWKSQNTTQKPKTK
ncbi:hypothetical protein PYW08_009841 [Mythimna loreyi]|uniref:Uncharacterized protein n=1 Tax=Mythimna loreyi TaxID=667449 RepID=A0ACC2Q779_9NEOP|nr:hypothetical protein PYW08_009841 [Mythimna loreyi]